ncbi:MAG: endonuclease domain-containing protein [Patescibacteria group bacterium]
MNMPRLCNNVAIKIKRRILRKNQTDAERKLWSILRNKQMDNLKFFRQYSVGPYILDFYCPKHKLVIELDGGQHGEEKQRAYDEERTNYLQQHNISVLRFWNDEVLTNIDGVATKIKEEIGSHS